MNKKHIAAVMAKWESGFGAADRPHNFQCYNNLQKEKGKKGEERGRCYQEREKLDHYG